MSVNIRGREYATVNERVAAFRNDYGLRGSIVTEPYALDSEGCIFKASIVIDGDLIATGFAEETRAASSINKTSYVENCETSAVGRALAFLGYGIDGSIASADEVTRAIERQEAPKPDYAALAQAVAAYAEAFGIDAGDVKKEAWKRLPKGATQEQVDQLAAEYEAETPAKLDIEF